MFLAFLITICAVHTLHSGCGSVSGATPLVTMDPDLPEEYLDYDELLSDQDPQLNGTLSRNMSTIDLNSPRLEDSMGEMMSATFFSATTNAKLAASQAQMQGQVQGPFVQFSPMTNGGLIMGGTAFQQALNQQGTRTGMQVRVRALNRGRGGRFGRFRGGGGGGGRGRGRFGRFRGGRGGRGGRLRRPLNINLEMPNFQQQQQRLQQQQPLQQQQQQLQMPQFQFIPTQFIAPQPQVASQVADRQVAARQVADRQVADRQVAARQVAAPQVVQQAAQVQETVPERGPIAPTGIVNMIMVQATPSPRPGKFKKLKKKLQKWMMQ